jgi:hypothetical protein
MFECPSSAGCREPGPARWRTWSVAGLLIASLAAAGAAAAQGKDDLWEVTVKMEVPGMPMAMPPVVSRSCTPKSAKDEDYIPAEKNCRMVERNRSGNKLNYKIVCEGKDPMIIAGELIFGTNSYEGRMKLSGMANGQPMQMTQNFSGKRVGDCTASSK